MFEINSLTFSYNDKKIINDLNLYIDKNEFIAIIGPNGSGKSTLLKNLSKIIKPDEGSIYLDYKNLNSLSAQDLAKKMSVVSQDTNVDFDFKVYDLVMMGRNPYQNRWGKITTEDKEIVKEALVLTDTIQFKDRSLNNLSGGERQRVIIARALAQEPEVLLLDEPTSSLDINYQGEIFDLLSHLNEKKDITIIVVSHDLNLASQYCNKLMLLKNGQIYSIGSAEEVLTKKNIREVYNAEVIIKENMISGRPYVALIPNKNKYSKKKNYDFNLHLVCGGGSAQTIIHKLYDLNINITAGVLNQGDNDWQLLKSYGYEVAEVEPFAYIKEEDLTYNRKLIEKADIIVVADLPFGHGNISNLRQLLDYKNKDIFLLTKRSINDRDYTGGEAKKIWDKLIQMDNVSSYDNFSSLIIDIKNKYNL
ncbi:MAG: ABC transporter ATP-binding protein [Bacillota bacterium]